MVWGREAEDVDGGFGVGVEFLVAADGVRQANRFGGAEVRFEEFLEVREVDSLGSEDLDE